MTQYEELKLRCEASLSTLSEMTDIEILIKYQKAIKSNSIKTILYHFIDFMRSSGDDVVIEALSKTREKSVKQIRKEFLSFVKSKKLNQQSFIALYNSLRFSSHLSYYLNYYYMDIILENSMKDYEVHILCMVFFQRCFINQDLIKSMKTYKKTNNNIF